VSGNFHVQLFTQHTVWHFPGTFLLIFVSNNFPAGGSKWKLRFSSVSSLPPKCKSIINFLRFAVCLFVWLFVPSVYTHTIVIISLFPELCADCYIFAVKVVLRHGGTCCSPQPPQLPPIPPSFTINIQLSRHFPIFQMNCVVLFAYLWSFLSDNKPHENNGTGGLCCKLIYVLTKYSKRNNKVILIQKVI